MSNKKSKLNSLTFEDLLRMNVSSTLIRVKAKSKDRLLMEVITFEESTELLSLTFVVKGNDISYLVEEGE